MKRPIITLNEWAESNGVVPITARKWASAEYLPAYRSPDAPGGTWLIPADTPVPPFRQLGTRSHKSYRAKEKLDPQELAAAVADATGLTAKQSQDAVGAACGAVAELLAGGTAVGLVGLGTLSVTPTIERNGVIPGTTQKILIPAGKKVTLKPSKKLKDSL